MKQWRFTLITTVALALMLSAVFAFADEEKKEKAGEEVTMTGEVLDLYCYMQHPDDGQGAEHAKCAKSCISRGLPIGFMAEGEVYLIIGSDHNSAAEMVAEFAGKESTITGIVITHHGVKAIELVSIAEPKS